MVRLPTIDSLIGQAVILQETLNNFLINSNLSAGDKASLSRSYNDFLRKCEKIRAKTQSN